MHVPSFREIHDFPDKVLHDDMGKLYLNITLRQFANSLLSVFIPLYLIELRFSLNEVLVFYAVFFGLLSLVSPLALRLGGWLGFKHVILYRTPLTVAYLLGLQVFLPKHAWLLYWIAVLGAVHTALYWMPLHSLFARASTSKRRGREVGMFQSLMHFSALAGPLLGGAVIVFLGYSLLFTLAIVLIILSAVPLFFTPDIRPEISLSTRLMFSREHSRFTAGFAAEGIIHVVGAVMWPLFIYTMIQSVLYVGAVATLTELGIVVFTLYIGRLSDLTKKETLLHLGGVLFSVMWFVRPLADTAPKIFTLGFLDGLLNVVVNIPFRTLFYDQAMRENPDEFVLFREVCLGISRAAVLLLLVFFTDKFLAAFVIAGMASLVFARF